MELRLRKFMTPIQYDEKSAPKFKDRLGKPIRKVDPTAMTITCNYKPLLTRNAYLFISSEITGSYLTDASGNKSLSQSEELFYVNEFDPTTEQSTLYYNINESWLEGLVTRTNKVRDEAIPSVAAPSAASSQVPATDHKSRSSSATNGHSSDSTRGDDSAERNFLLLQAQSLVQDTSIEKVPISQNCSMRRYNSSKSIQDQLFWWAKLPDRHGNIIAEKYDLLLTAQGVVIISSILDTAQDGEEAPSEDSVHDWHYWVGLLKFPKSEQPASPSDKPKEGKSRDVSSSTPSVQDTTSPPPVEMIAKKVTLAELDTRMKELGQIEQLGQKRTHKVRDDSTSRSADASSSPAHSTDHKISIRTSAHQQSSDTSELEDSEFRKSVLLNGLMLAQNEEIGELQITATHNMLRYKADMPILSQLHSWQDICCLHGAVQGHIYELLVTAAGVVMITTLHADVVPESAEGASGESSEHFFLQLLRFPKGEQSSLTSGKPEDRKLLSGPSSQDSASPPPFESIGGQLTLAELDTHMKKLGPIAYDRSSCCTIL